MARDLPTVTYRADVADIHDDLVGLAAELPRRIHHAYQHGDTDDLPCLTVVVFEGADHTLRKLTGYWDTVREKDAPKTSPAVNALREPLSLTSRSAAPVG